MASPAWSPPYDWTDERERRLRQMWSEKYSQSQIAEALGCGRSAVAGKIKRLGITRGVVVRSAKSGAKPATERKPGLQRLEFGAIGLARQAVKRKPHSAAEAPPAPVSSNPVPLMQRQPGACCWPLWGSERDLPTEARLYCGDPVGTKPGSGGQRLPDSYCKAHRAISWSRGTESERRAA